MPIEVDKSGSRVIVFAAGTEVSSTKSNPSFSAAACFPFRGSGIWGTPRKIQAVAFVDSGATGRLRIQDVTNGLTICTSAVISNTIAAVVDLGAIANVPVDEAVWELQMIRDTGTGNSSIYCCSLMLVPGDD